MRFVCDSCHAQYMISDDKVGARGVKVRCKKCGHTIQVRREEPAAAPPEHAAAPAHAPTAPEPGAVAQGGPSIGGDFLNDLDDDELGNVFDQVLGGGAPQAPEREEPEAPPPAPPPEPARHDWFVAIDEQQVGPLSLEALRERWEKGEVGADSLCWREGFADWLPLSEVAELAPVLAPRTAGAAPIVAPAGEDISISISSPVLTPDAAPAFKPSAASLLASLVQEEHAALAKPKPAPRPPPAAAAPGLLDVPLADPNAPTIPAVPVLQPVPHPAAFATGQHTPSPAGPYAPPVASYVPPAYAPPRKKTGLIVGLAVGGVALIASAAAVTYFVARPPAPAPVQQQPVAAAPAVPVPQQQPAPVAQQPVATPPQQQVAAQTPSPATAAPAPVQQTAAAPTVPAAAPAATPEPEKREEVASNGSTSRKRTSRTREREEAPAPAPTPRPEVRQASAKVPDTGDDDFDSLFGTKKASAPAPEKKAATTYVPPAPGSANLPERLTQSDIMQVVLASRPSIIKCVEEQKKRDPGASGRLVMRWTIGTNGRTKGVSCQTDEFRSSYMASCLSGLIKGMSFPRHQEQGDPIDFPFTF